MKDIAFQPPGIRAHISSKVRFSFVPTFYHTCMTVVCAVFCAQISSAEISINIDNSHGFAWSPSIGWLSFGSPSGDVLVHFSGDSGYLSGFVWGENIGWINLGVNGGGPYDNTSATDWGVNIESNGTLNGYAWSPSVGWINFDHDLCDASLDFETGHFSGHAWGENIGWLQLRGDDPGFGVRARSFDQQLHGTPNWWLFNYSVSEDYDAGDGVEAWKKFVMDTNPLVSGDFLKIQSVLSDSSETVVTFGPVSRNRIYRLMKTDRLESGWLPAAGGDGAQGTGDSMSFIDTNEGDAKFYSVEVQLP